MIQLAGPEYEAGMIRNKAGEGCGEDDAEPGVLDVRTLPLGPWGPFDAFMQDHSRCPSGLEWRTNQTRILDLREKTLGGPDLPLPRQKN